MAANTSPIWTLTPNVSGADITNTVANVNTTAPGTIGTKGGPRTDVHGRVLHVSGQPIAGLYAAGNVAASIFGPGYPGAGGTMARGVVTVKLGG